MNSTNLNKLLKISGKLVYVRYFTSQLIISENLNYYIDLILKVINILIYRLYVYMDKIL